MATSSSASSTADSVWIYFLAGALLPSLAWILMHKKSSASPLKSDSNDSNDSDDSDGDDSDMEGVVEGGPSSKWGYTDAPYKMVLCVNQELTMGKGKMAAQCCHAAVGCYKRASKQCPKGLRAWEYSGCAKIALKCPTQDEMELIAAKAMERDIPICLVEDAGRTQIAAGSRTVLGLGPAPAHVFEGITSHLKLM
jgi:PTH2 family peptidyl-tRNA hydrolase